MQQHERLTKARQGAGYRTRTEAAKALGVAVATYVAHENGHRGLTVQSSEKYAKAFNVRSAWLLTGEEPEKYWEDMETGIADLERDRPSPEQWGRFAPGRPYKGSMFRELPEVSPWSDDRAQEGYDVVGEWLFPTDFMSQTLQASPRSIFLINAPDDSMSPTFSAGDRAIIDSSQNTFRGEGIYALQDSDGNLFLRDLTRVIINPPKDGNIGVSTTKPGGTYFTNLSTLNIAGRAIGKVGKI